MGYFRAKIDLRQNPKDSFSYWEPLWEQKTTSYKEVFIQCWNEETKYMADILPHALKVRREGLVHYFRVELNEANRQYLKQHSIEGKKLKWFLIRFIEEDGSEGIEIRDYGAEVIFNQLTPEELESVSELFQVSKAKIEFLKDEQDD